MQGRNYGAILGLVFGVILDVLVGKSIGYTGIFLGVIGLLGEYFDKNFSKDSRVTIILMSLGATILFEVCMYITYILKFKIGAEVMEFSITLAIEAVYNMLLVIILYPGMKKLGYYIEDEYKGKKLLTHYF